MPTVYIWYPDKNNKYGHAALQTDKYHISFWPDGDVKDYGVEMTAAVGIPGSLVFHHELDRHLENNQLPTAIYEIINTTDGAINRIHEEFLRYNGIDPEDVTMEVAEKLLDDREMPHVSVSKTRYTFVADIRGQLTPYDVLPDYLTQNAKAPPSQKPPWYHCKQSCVSFCYHMIENADPDPQSIGTKLLDFIKFDALDNFTVPWFENFVKKHWGRYRELHKLNLSDNSVTRTARYWLWDRWTSNSQSAGKNNGEFLDVPVIFKVGNQERKKERRKN